MDFVLGDRLAQPEDLKLYELTWAVTRLRQSRSEEELARIAQRLAGMLASAGQGELRRTFAHWLRALARRLEDALPPPQPPEDLELEDIVASLEEIAAEWPKPAIRRGIILGREQSMEHERQLLWHQATVRFDSATADRLAAVLAKAGPQRLMDVGEAIMRCTTGDALLREVGSRR